MSVQDPPPAAWRYCGDQLKRWRTRAGVSREELGAAAKYAPDTIKSMEQGVRMPTPQLLDAADALLRAEGLLSAAKDFVRREKYSFKSLDFMAREREAASMWWYETILIPGLLQTRPYSRALISDHWPPLDEETVETRVTARLERQAILGRTPPAALSFILYEAALRGSYVDKGQLVHLLEVRRLRNVSVQVLPYAKAKAASLLGPMLLLETVDHERLAFTEGPSMSQLTADAEVVGTQAERISMLRMEALSSAGSADFIKRMVDEL
ncbi:helix-turn-helix domain-containing protein [Streptomyces sp. NBC_01383]|uniref:helix-turn-helix domain-containing protein n=1 Tax=Streptomyces sp. NBC_01383 TaxID=2903846 RepID=UPI003244FC31